VLTLDAKVNFEPLRNEDSDSVGERRGVVVFSNIIALSKKTSLGKSATTIVSS
jgi:hypothetical protein